MTLSCNIEGLYRPTCKYNVRRQNLKYARTKYYETTFTGDLAR